MTPSDDCRPAARPCVLAVHPGALGDVVLFGHLLARLEGEVVLVAGGEKGRLLAGCGVVGRAVDLEALPMHEVFTDTPPGDCALPGLLGGCERLVSCFASGDRRAEGRLAAMCGCGTAAFLPVRPPEGFAGHLLELWCDLLGLPADQAGRPRAWAVPEAARRGAREALRAAGAEPDGPYAVVHPGAGSPGKCWPLERFFDLARRLPQPVFVLGEVELDRWSAGPLAAVRDRFPTLACPPLDALAGALAGASVFVGNDSGPSHLAAAVGAPTVALFGPTRPEHFSPVGPAVRVVAAREVAAVSVSRVEAAVRSLAAGGRAADEARRASRGRRRP